MSFEYEKLCAARVLLEELMILDDVLFAKRSALMDDLVALERERDERLQERRREARLRRNASAKLLKRVVPPQKRAFPSRTRLVA